MNPIRYLVEHQALPNLLFTDPDFPDLLLEGQAAVMADLYRIVGRMVGEKAGRSFRESDFRFDLHAMAGDPEDDRMFLIINMPEAEEPPQCERVFVCLRRDSDDVGYFTVEKSVGYSVLCSWDRAGAHCNYGDAPAAEEEQLQRVMELFA